MINGLTVNVMIGDNIMEEKIISFECAKLAKEKGFDERVWDYYSNSNTELIRGILDNGMIKYNKDPDYLGVYSAPTQSLLQKWLREEHNLHIVMRVEFKDTYKTQIFTGYAFVIYDLRSPKVPFKYGRKVLDYETSLEAALHEALNLI